MTLKELLAIDEGGECPGCPVCEPPKTRRGGPSRRSVSVLVSQDAAAFSVRYTDARRTPTKDEGEGVIAAASYEA